MTRWACGTDEVDCGEFDRRGASRITAPQTHRLIWASIQQAAGSRQQARQIVLVPGLMTHRASKGRRRNAEVVTASTSASRSGRSALTAGLVGGMMCCVALLMGGWGRSIKRGGFVRSINPFSSSSLLFALARQHHSGQPIESNSGRVRSIDPADQSIKHQGPGAPAHASWRRRGAAA